MLSACVYFCMLSYFQHLFSLRYYNIMYNPFLHVAVLRKVIVNGGTKYFKGGPIFSEIFCPRQTNFVEVRVRGPIVGGPIFLVTIV